MGQQQLLLLVLAVIIVGIAIVVGITMFRSQSASSNLDALTNDLMDLGSRAQQYWVRPTSMGGGGGFMTGCTMGHLTASATGTYTSANDNGSYTLDPPGAQLVQITGVGKQDGNNDGTNCTARVRVVGTDSLYVTVDNR
jgi:hypothetical protein